MPNLGIFWSQNWPFVVSERPQVKHCQSCVALLALSVTIELVSSSARVTSVKFQQPLGLTDGHPDPKIGPQVYLGLINIFL